MKKSWAIYILFIILILGLVEVVLACSCATPRTPIRELEASTVVFKGEVTNINSLDSFNERISFIISKVWKGNLGDEVSLTTSSQGSLCGFSFVKNKEYLVYAYGNLSDLKTNICWRTKLLSEASDDVKELDNYFGGNSCNRDSDCKVKFSACSCSNICILKSQDSNIDCARACLIEESNTTITSCKCENNKCVGVVNRVGNDRDSYGCIGSAGYSWCDSKQKCIRSWEENCSINSNKTCDVSDQSKCDKSCSKNSDCSYMNCFCYNKDLIITNIQNLPLAPCRAAHLECECINNQCKESPGCGDGKCLQGEDHYNCKVDCGGLNVDKCGDGVCYQGAVCDGPGCQKREDEKSCPEDCNKNNKVKIMPETASGKAIERLGQLGFNISLKEVGQDKKPVYEVSGVNEGKMLGFFKIKGRVSVEVDAETGEIIKIKKPWWSFLAGI